MSRVGKSPIPVPSGVTITVSADNVVTVKGPKGELQQAVVEHRALLDEVLELFSIVPDYDLDVMWPNQSPTAVGAEVMRGLEPVLVAERPDWVLVQGDTTTAAMGSIAPWT